MRSLRPALTSSARRRRCPRLSTRRRPGAPPHACATHEAKANKGRARFPSSLCRHVLGGGRKQTRHPPALGFQTAPPVPRGAAHARPSCGGVLSPRTHGRHPVATHSSRGARSWQRGGAPRRVCPAHQYSGGGGGGQAKVDRQAGRQQRSAVPRPPEEGFSHTQRNLSVPRRRDSVASRLLPLKPRAPDGRHAHACLAGAGGAAERWWLRHTAPPTRLRLRALLGRAAVRLGVSSPHRVHHLGGRTLGCPRSRIWIMGWGTERGGGGGGGGGGRARCGEAGGPPRARPAPPRQNVAQDWCCSPKESGVGGATETHFHSITPLSRPPGQQGEGGGRGPASPRGPRWSARRGHARQFLLLSNTKEMVVVEGGGHRLALPLRKRKGASATRGCRHTAPRERGWDGRARRRAAPC